MDVEVAAEAAAAAADEELSPLEEEEEEEEEDDEVERPVAVDALDQFKADVLSLEDGAAARIVLYNVNLPRRLWQDEASLIRIRNLVTRDFRNVDGIYFQLSATYTLVNRETGEIRTWSGSFNPRNRVASELTSHAPFEPDSFVPFFSHYPLLNWWRRRRWRGGHGGGGPGFAIGERVTRRSGIRFQLE